MVKSAAMKFISSTFNLHCFICPIKVTSHIIKHTRVQQLVYLVYASKIQLVDAAISLFYDAMLIGVGVSSRRRTKKKVNLNSVFFLN